MLQYLMIRIITGILQIFPLRVIRLLKYPLGFAFYIFSFRSTIRLVKRKRYLKQNKLLDISPLKLKIYYTQYWLETFWLNKRVVASPEKYVSIKEIDKINRVISNNEGFIIALPHQGNWEFAIPAGNKLGLKLVAVAEPLHNKKILEWFLNLRTQLGCKIILGGSNTNIYSKVKNEIVNGKAVCLVSERHIKKSGVAVNFFGKLAAFPTGPINLALETGCPVIPTTCLATKSGFTIHFGEPFYVPMFGNKAQSLQNGLKTLAYEFEQLIRLDPNQWHSTVAIWSDE